LRAFLEEEFLHDGSAIFEIIDAQEFKNFCHNCREGTIVRRVLTLKIWCNLFLERKAKATGDILCT
jgi:hypothetical protein